MTKTEYALYKETVAKYLEGIESVSTGPCVACPECRRDYGLPDNAEELEIEICNEPHISKHPCEICGDRFAGNREEWHGVLDGKMIHGTCCLDCVYFLNYGHLDDKTMAEIERSPE